MSVTEQMMMYAEQFNQRIDSIEQFMHSHDFTLNRDVMESVRSLSAAILELNDR